MPINYGFIVTDATGGTGLIVNISSGAAIIPGYGQIFYPGGTLTLTDNSNNYLYLSGNGIPSYNTTDYLHGSVAIAFVLTASGVISTITKPSTAGDIDLSDYNSTDGINLLDTSSNGISIIEENAAVSLNLGSAGGIVIQDNSTNSLTISESGTSGIVIIDSGGGISIVEEGDGPFTFNGNPVVTALVGVTSAIGGSPLTLGQTASGAVSITGASAAIAEGGVIVATPVTTSAPGSGFLISANLTDTDTVTVYVNCLVAGTPTSSEYNVKVL